MRVLILLVVMWALILGGLYLGYRYKVKQMEMEYEREQAEREQTDKIMDYVEDDDK